MRNEKAEGYYYGSPVHLAPLGTKAIFEGQARFSQLQYLYNASDRTLSFDDFEKASLLKGIYAEAFNLFLAIVKEARPVNPKLEMARDLLVLGCLTGLRFSDFSNIKPEDIRNGKLRIKQQKSDHCVVIPLRPIAHDILITKFKAQIPKTSNAGFNDDIKRVCEIAEINESIKFSYKKGNRDIEEIKPKYKWITSHSCRRSFCTNEFLAGTPVELIMKISGHRSLKDFYRYIKVTPDQAAFQIEKDMEGKRGGYFTQLKTCMFYNKLIINVLSNKSFIKVLFCI